MKSGDRVKIRKDSQYWSHGTDTNPRHIAGKILRIDNTSIRVLWDNGKYNIYTQKDLEFAEAGKIDIGYCGYIETIEGIAEYVSFDKLDSLHTDHPAFKKWKEYKLSGIQEYV